MGIRIWALVDAVTEAHADMALTTVQAGSHVFAVVTELGYPHPLDTGVWALDVPVILRTVAARIREGC